MKRLISSTILIIFVALIGLPPPPATGAEDKGREVYKKKCAICHGKKGIPKKFAKKAHTFTDPKWQDSTTLEEIKKIITEGRGKMKGFKTKLTVEEIEEIAFYIKTMN